ncbi:MAG: NUDIX domain-containing protein [Candidatus Saccharimonadales bacterium]
MEEQYDVLDKQGNPTGEVLPKSVVHDRELLHASVFIWIYNMKGEVLLQLRAQDKKSFPGVWDVSVAGHMSAGDTPLQTAVREIKEEIGIDIHETELQQVEFTSDVVPWLPNKTHPEFCWVYILYKELDPTKLEIQEEELTGVRLESLVDIKATRLKPGSEKIYAARNPKIYDSAFNEIEKIIS